MIHRPRIGCVPYLNAKPLIDWFHSPDCDSPAEVVYAPPSELACLLRESAVDVALVSSYEMFRNPRLKLIPGISVSADGPVRSVRLFSKLPFNQIQSVALDTSSLTSVALIRILLADRYGIRPQYIYHPPDLDRMLDAADAALLIGDLHLFDSAAEFVMDLGEEWKQLTGLPFLYAAWLARPEADLEAIGLALSEAKSWGVARLNELADIWAERMNLPLERVREYFLEIMQYDLTPQHMAGFEEYHNRCHTHNLIAEPLS